MKPRWLPILALATTGILAGCSSVSTTNYGDAGSSVTCDTLLQRIVERERSGDTSGARNAEMDVLSRSCSVEYDIATDYFSISTSSVSLGPKACASWLEYDIRPEAIELLREDGLCDDGGVNVQAGSAWPDGGMGWDDARDYAGTSQRVCGPLVSLRNTGDGAFLNVGLDYPSPDRFTFIIWGVSLEPIENGATICGAGSIYLYGGVAQIELATPEEVEIWR